MNLYLTRPDGTLLAAAKISRRELTRAQSSPRAALSLVKKLDVSPVRRSERIGS